jgi:hypothetical protein
MDGWMDGDGRKRLYIGLPRVSPSKSLVVTGYGDSGRAQSASLSMSIILEVSSC